MAKHFSVLILLSLAAFAQAAEPAWVPVTTDLLQHEKTGFGGLCGVVVDHASGDVWVNLSDRGMFHSADQGKTWNRVSDAQPKEMKGIGGLSWLEYDPRNDTLYLMKMGSDLYRLTRWK